MRVTCVFEIKHDPIILTTNHIPYEIGLYVWISKGSGEIVYIGKATGIKGLRRRIFQQHLNPNYLESRTSKFTDNDIHQVETNPLMLHDRICIDKSSFRKSVARYHLLTAGEESVSFLKQNFYVAFESFMSNQKAYVIETEARLIKEIKPLYNNKGK
jgi:hypothetical protein